MRLMSCGQCEYFCVNEGMTFRFRGSDGFFLKISNLNTEERNFISLIEYNKTAQIAFFPRATDAFVLYAQFPVDFSQFKRFVLAELQLPRLSEPQIFMFCSFWNEYRKLDDSRFRAVRTCFDVNGRPELESNRKIYVICDWAQVQMF